jgi:hypothetical protein
MHRDKSEAVLPPLRTLAAYTTQNLISVDGCGRAIRGEKFIPLSWKKG